MFTSKLDCNKYQSTPFKDIVSRKSTHGWWLIATLYIFTKERVVLHIRL